MPVSIIFAGILLFFACLALHVALWRIKVMNMSALLLAFIFLGLPVLAGAGLVITGYAGGNSGISIMALAQVFLLHYGLALAYIAGYPAARAFSPSLDILMIVKSSPGGSMAENEILESYIGHQFVPPRFDTLRVYHLVREIDGRYELAAAGRVVVSVFLIYRRLLGISPGRG